MTERLHTRRNILRAIALVSAGSTPVVGHFLGRSLAKNIIVDPKIKADAIFIPTATALAHEGKLTSFIPEGDFGSEIYEQVKQATFCLVFWDGTQGYAGTGWL